MEEDLEDEVSTASSRLRRCSAELLGRGNRKKLDFNGIQSPKQLDSS